VTRVFGKLFSDDRSGILVVKPSQPFFGVSRDERHYPVTDGAIDFALDPTPSGVHYLIGFKNVGDIRRTDYTLRWRVPAVDSFDVTPGAANAKIGSQEVAPKASVYERVQLKRVASDLTDTIEDNQQLSTDLVEANLRIKQLQDELRGYKKTSELVLSQRDQTIAQLSEFSEPVINTVYLEKPVPPAALQSRVYRLESEIKRLLDVNAEYYKSVVQLHQLQLDKARTNPEEPQLGVTNTPQSRLLRKLLGK
jgi:hypothetical protein